MSEKITMNYNEDQELQLIRGYIKMTGSKEIKLFRLSEELPKIVVLGGDGETKTVFTEGLGLLAIGADEFDGRELMMRMSPDFDADSDDKFIVFNQMMNMCIEQIECYCDGYMICSSETTDEFHERFGYDHIILLYRKNEIRISDVGSVIVSLAVPVYEEEYQKYLHYYSDERNFQTLIDKILSWYEKNDIRIGTVDVQRNTVITADRSYS